ncbi:MAG: pyridoxine 5'-phosphate synthase [Bdellovibrionota bacterium]|mgnify:CR=1 FL=1
MIRLGVNVDHIATLRQLRGGSTPYPDLLFYVKESVRAGADQITIHLREDRRHIQLNDLKLLAKNCPVNLNLEMAASSEMLKLAKKYKPTWCCFVPEKRQELTTEGGLDVLRNEKKIKLYAEKLQSFGIEISLFIEPNLEQIRSSYRVGADAIELHTGKWVLLKGRRKQLEWRRLVEAAKLGHKLGMRVHAGHGLDLMHTQKIKFLPFLREVNIGHFLICDSLKDGLFASVQRMKKTLTTRKS